MVLHLIDQGHRSHRVSATLEVDPDRVTLALPFAADRERLSVFGPSGRSRLCRNTARRAQVALPRATT